MADLREPNAMHPAHIDAICEQDKPGRLEHRGKLIVRRHRFQKKSKLPPNVWAPLSIAYWGITVILLMASHKLINITPSSKSSLVAIQVLGRNAGQNRRSPHTEESNNSPQPFTYFMLSITLPPRTSLSGHSSRKIFTFFLVHTNWAYNYNFHIGAHCSRGLLELYKTLITNSPQLEHVF